jgi:hypothetical protein
MSGQQLANSVQRASHSTDTDLDCASSLGTLASVFPALGATATAGLTARPKSGILQPCWRP